MGNLTAASTIKMKSSTVILAALAMALCVVNAQDNSTDVVDPAPADPMVMNVTVPVVDDMDNTTMPAVNNSDNDNDNSSSPTTPAVDNPVIIITATTEPPVTVPADCSNDNMYYSGVREYTQSEYFRDYLKTSRSLSTKCWLP